MILEELKVNAIHSETPQNTLKMRVSQEDINKFIPFLRDHLYSNKIGAVIREYSTNSRDEHIEYGIPNVPIQVTLPSTFSPELRIRDFGAGLTIQEIDEIYIQYLKSTKRNNNDVNGLLGIGCKSAFCYSDSFIVTSWCNGRKVIYQFLADGNVIPMADVEMTPDEKTGMEIFIPVALKDINQFIDEALNFYKYWDIKPILLNVEQGVIDSYFKPMEEKPIFYDDIWEIRPGGHYGYGKSVAIMSFVPYVIDWEMIRNNMDYLLRDKMYYIFDFLKSNNVLLRLPNGSIDFTPNRETLQYNEKTVGLISSKVEEMYNKILKIITDKISTATNLWEAKIIFNKIFDATILGKDYAETAEFGGNLKSIRNILGKNIQWNSIPLENGIFESLYNWDADVGDVSSTYSRRNKYHNVLETYIKNSGKINCVELKRCNRNKNNSIVCSPKNLILINDIPKQGPRASSARYIMYKLDTNIEKVYLLNLYDTNIKQAFYNHYKFDSVPVIKISDILLDVKKYIKDNRIINSGGGNNTITSSSPSITRSYQPVEVSYLSITNLKNSYNDSVNNTHWNKDITSIRGITGGIYVECDHNKILLGNKTIEKDCLNYFVQNIYEFCKITNTNIDKVYGIPTRIINSKWFKKSINNGNWIDIKTFIKNELSKLDKNSIQKSIEFSNLENYNSNLKYIGPLVAEKILPDLSYQDGDMFKYCKDIIVDIPKFYSIKTILYSFGFEDNFKEIVFDFKTKCKKIESKYPLIFKLNFSDKLPYCKTNYSEYKINDQEASDIVHYINLVDCCDDVKKSLLTTDGPL